MRAQRGKHLPKGEKTNNRSLPILFELIANQLLAHNVVQMNTARRFAGSPKKRKAPREQTPIGGARMLTVASRGVNPANPAPERLTTRQPFAKTKGAGNIVRVLGVAE